MKEMCIFGLASLAIMFVNTSENNIILSRLSQALGIKFLEDFETKYRLET